MNKECGTRAGLSLQFKPPKVKNQNGLKLTAILTLKLNRPPFKFNQSGQTGPQPAEINDLEQNQIEANSCVNLCLWTEYLHYDDDIQR